VIDRISVVNATRYVAPLREGGSLPGLVEADDFGTYVVKFRGAGQGLKVLVAEVVVGELGRRLGLRVPELRAVQLDAAIGRYEADEEVQDLLTASVGLNLAVDFLPGSFGWDAGFAVPEQEALRVLWLDAFTANVDRSWRNPNLLIWHRELWLIDHGAALYFHHSWQSSLDPERFAAQRYDATEHVFASYASALSMVDEELAGLIDENLLVEILVVVPVEWLEPAGGVSEPTAIRRAYVDYLLARLANRTAWLLAATGGGR
jgi:hypothetical protein